VINVDIPFLASSKWRSR